MRKIDKLYRLIDSLDKSEKRHFILYANAFSKKGENNEYISLFKYIDKHKIQNDESLLKIIPTNTFNKLTNVKSYLYKKILESLIINSNNKIDDLYLEVLKSRQLLNKRLYSDAIMILDRLQTKNKSLNTAFTLLDNHLHKYILTSLNADSKHNYEMKATDILYEIKDFLSIQTLENEYFILSVEVYRMALNIKIDDKENQKKLSGLLLHPLLKNQDYLKSFNCYNCYFNTKMTIYEYLKDKEMALQTAKEHFEFSLSKQETNPTILTSIIESWYNLLRAIILNNNKEYFTKYIDFLEDRAKESNTLLGIYHFYKYQALLEFTTKYKAIDIFESREIEKQLTQNINNLKLSPFQKKNLQYFLARYFFNLKNFDKSLDILREILSTHKLETTSNMELSISILFFLNHLESKNYQYIHNIITSFQKKLKSKKPDANSLHMIMNQLKRLTKHMQKTNSKEDISQTIYRKILSLIANETNKDLQNLYELSHLQEWVKGKSDKPI